MRNLPSLAAIRVFEAAARHESFTQAAAELGMTQAAVSYQIRLLEDRLGVLLFNRSKGRVSLSDAGRKAAPMAANAFDMLEDAFAGLLKQGQAVLSISTTPTFASSWLAPRLGTFQINQPDLAVRLGTNNHMVDFISEETDVAIRSGRGPWPGLRQHFLLRSYMTPMCSPDFQSRYQLYRPEQLLDVPRLSPKEDWWKLWLDAADVAPSNEPSQPGIWLDSQVMEANAVMAGHGIALLTPLFWQSELAAGRLVQPFPLVVMAPSSYWLVYPEHRRNHPKIRAFREWLLAEIKLSAATGPAGVFTEPVDIS